jgi:PIN domain nuclease of toxin-antitoxin system
VELELVAEGAEVPGDPVAVILLDTNALIWLDRGHPRIQALRRVDSPLYISPATLLELQFLEEAGRIRLPRKDAQALAVDDRWVVDDPPAATWFSVALDVGWTRDPFDRLIVAHARLRGWKLATGDASLLSALGPRQTVEL